MKKFFENYGFIAISAVVIVLLISFTTPVGAVIKNSISGLVDKFATTTNAVTDNTLDATKNTLNLFTHGASEEDEDVNLAPGLYVGDEMYKALTLDDCGTDALKVRTLITKANTKVVLPEGVTSIGERYFKDYSNITKFVIPKTVTTIGMGAFYNCSNLTSVVIPNSVTSIGASAFCDCKNLQSIKLPNKLTSLGSSAFYGCDGLKSVSLPDTLTVINSSTFKDCSNLEFVKLPNNIETIDQFAFQLCNLKQVVVLPESIKTIKQYAFGSNESLTVVVPNTVESVDDYAFIYVPIVIYNGNLTTTWWGDGATHIYASMDNNFIYKDSQKTTIQQYIGNSSSVTIPKSVTKIEYNAFEGNKIETVIFEDGTQIQTLSGFCGATNLKSITIPSSVTEIDNSAFSGCTSLTSITIPNSVEIIQGFAFNGCTNLESVSLPDSLIEIVWYAFDGCTSLTITIPNSVDRIGDNAFRNVPQIYYDGWAILRGGSPWGALAMN